MTAAVLDRPVWRMADEPPAARARDGGCAVIPRTLFPSELATDPGSRSSPGCWACHGPRRSVTC